MKTERRDHQRVKTSSIPADIFPMHPTEQEVALSGEIIDISRTGIRIRLDKALGKVVNENLKITMKLPDTGAPFTVHGKLKHQHSDTEYGVHYIQQVEGSIDDLLFECIQLNDSTLLIKSLSKERRLIASR